MKQTKKFSNEEFAQFTTERVDRLEGRLKGMIIVMNAFANELRNQDPEIATRLSNTISDWALSQNPTEHVEEIVQLFSTVLNHDRKVDFSELQ
jgi:hypothetical protein